MHKERGLAIANCARTYIDTPYQHQARLKGVAIDCVGLIIEVAKELDYVPKEFNYSNYSRVPDGKLLIERLENHMIPVSQQEMQVGDVICISFSRHPQHVGILGDYRHGGFSIIHAAMPPGRVIETRLLFGNLMQFKGAYRFPENRLNKL